MSNHTNSMADKINELLQSDATFSTRSGVRFLTEVIRDAFEYIEKEQQRNKEADDMQNSIKTRLTNVETGLNEFLTIRKNEQLAAADERKFYRRAVIGGIITIILSEAARWLLLK
jgi:predicted small metal-binding protein